MQVAVQDRRVVGEIAEILRSVVMQDIAAVRDRAAGGSRRSARRFIGIQRVVGVEALLVPAPLHRPVEGGDLVDVLLHVEQIGGRVGVGRDDLVDVGPHVRQRLGRERQVERRIRGAFVVGVVRRLDGVRVEVGARERAGVGDDGNIGIGRRLRGVGGVARAVDVLERRVGIGRHRAFGRVLGPLRLAGLAGDDRDGVRRRGTDDRLMEVVEEHEVLRPAPHERDRVAIDMGDVVSAFCICASVTEVGVAPDGVTIVPFALVVRPSWSMA